MKQSAPVVLAFLAFLANCGIGAAECTATVEPVQIKLGEGASKISFAGFVPSVKRFTAMPGEGSYIKFHHYTAQPMITLDGTVLTVKAGEACEHSGSTGAPATVSPTMSPTKKVKDPEPAGSGSFQKMAAFSIPLLFGANAKLPAAALAAIVASGIGLPLATAQDVSVTSCDTATIEVDIYIGESIDQLVMAESQSGDFEICPPESLYWEHHPDVYGGYKGCVGENSYYPCGQDSTGVDEEEGALYAKYPINYINGSCVETGYTMENRTFWVLWGDPLDKFELNLRTGLNPTVTFPFNRGPYPQYQNGVSLDIAIDDSSDARAAAKDLLTYIGAWTKEELADWSITMTEGAESGMTAMWAAKALEIAQTTCNRDIYALMEAPAYGYAPGDSAIIANKLSSTFYEGPECMCFDTITNTSTCKEPTVTVSNVGWLPLTPFPVRMGGDGNNYTADSTSSASPWFESMCFPENPSGKIKTPQLQDANRRVCDGVYLWPMYFGMEGYKIPVDKIPDCSSWSFSITKAYSATVRAGFIMYKNAPETSHAAMVSVMDDLYSMTNGLYSEWSWYGQMQLWDMIMSRPVSDPTSWLGAYSVIMDEKWNAVIEGFADCPVVTLTNPKAGAYAYFKYNIEFVGIEDDFVSGFFRDVLGVRTTTYNWGYRGADPADFYGEGYGVADFTRLQLFRDVNVYTEIGRRAKIVCADLDASIGDFVSVNQWTAAKATLTRRRMQEGYASIEERELHLKEVIPSLTDRQAKYMAYSHEATDKVDKNVQNCAPNFSTTCMFKMAGTRHKDFEPHEVAIASV